MAAQDARRAVLRGGEAGHTGPHADAHAPAHRERPGVRGHGVVREPDLRRSDGSGHQLAQATL